MLGQVYEFICLHIENNYSDIISVSSMLILKMKVLNYQSYQNTDWLV